MTNDNISKAEELLNMGFTPKELCMRALRVFIANGYIDSFFEARIHDCICSGN